MNPIHPSHQALHGPTNPPFILGPKAPRLSLNQQNEPAFMQPLLPPRHPQNNTNYAEGPSSSSPCPPVPAPPDFFVQATAFQGHLPTVPLQSLQSHGAASYVPDASDEEYPCEFSSFDAFQRWRSEIEEQEMVEFLKSDTSRSKTVPPSFNELIKLSCSRNIKSARNKYVNTLPERNRSMHPSQRNTEEEGCPASISYRTYFGTPVVRAKYINQHSHPIGRENLPFTRRGRNNPEHERRTQQQNVFYRTNAVMDGTIPPAASIPLSSNNREVRNMDAARIEPPPMASLKPPDSPTKDSLAAAPVEYHQKQHHIGPAQVSAPQDRLPRPTATLQDGAPVSALASQPHATYDRNRDAIPQLSKAAWTVPPVARSNGRTQAYRAAPPPVPPPLPPPYNTNAPVNQPQPTYLSQTAEALNHQAQYLPTPTTPSAQIQNLHSYPYPYPYSEALCRREPETQNQAAPIPNGSHVSPLSPVTPHTQHLPGPPGRPSAVDVRPPPVPQYSPREVYSFNESRWNHLDALFQSVRLRARSHPYPEHGIVALESLLSRLYTEGQPMYSRPEGGQPPVYLQQQQQQQQHPQQSQQLQ